MCIVLCDSKEKFSNIVFYVGNADNLMLIFFLWKIRKITTRNAVKLVLE